MTNCYSFVYRLSSCEMLIQNSSKMYCFISTSTHWVQYPFIAAQTYWTLCVTFSDKVTLTLSTWLIFDLNQNASVAQAWTHDVNPVLQYQWPFVHPPRTLTPTITTKHQNIHNIAQSWQSITFPRNAVPNCNLLETEPPEKRPSVCSCQWAGASRLSTSEHDLTPDNIHPFALPSSCAGSRGAGALKIESPPPTNQNYDPVTWQQIVSHGKGV